jgi:hypothetical protein
VERSANRDQVESPDGRLQLLKAIRTVSDPLNVRDAPFASLPRGLAEHVRLRIDPDRVLKEEASWSSSSPVPQPRSSSRPLPPQLKSTRRAMNCSGYSRR